MNVEERLDKIRVLLDEAAVEYRRMFRDPDPYATSQNGFVVLAEQAWFRAVETLDSRTNVH